MGRVQGHGGFLTVANFDKFDIRNFIDRLTPDPKGRKDRFVCPICEDNNFTIDMSNGAYGCHSTLCTKTEEGRKELRDTVAPLEKAPRASTRAARPTKVVKAPAAPAKAPRRKDDRTWVYTDVQGNPIVKTRRIDDGQGKKKVWQEYIDKSRKKFVIPYRYFEALEAARGGAEVVFWVEGEPCADALWGLGIPAMTSIAGSGGYRSYGDYKTLLEGFPAPLVVCPDQDATGLKYAGLVAADLGIEQWCRAYPDSPIWENPPKSGGLDIADWIEAGATADQIRAAITQAAPAAPAAEPEAGGVGLSVSDLVERIRHWEEIESPTEKWEAWEALKGDSGKNHRDLMDLARAIKVKPEATDDEWAISAKAFGGLDLGAREWLLEGLLPANRTILVGADAKTGKSLLVYDWAYSLATGQAWGEFPCDRPRKILIVQTDESEIDCQERINARGLNELDNVRIIRSFTPALMPRLRRVALDWGAEVIIFDSLTSIQRHSGYSPKDPEYGYWLYDLKDFATECRITPILITHTNKAPIDLGLDKVAGSYSITAAVSEIFMLVRPNDPASDCDRVLVRVGSRSSGQSAWLIGLNLEDYSWEYKFPCTKEGGPIEDDGGFTPDEKLNCRENVIRFLAHHQGKGFESLEIAETLGASYNNVRKICSELRSQGLILRRKSGKAWVYSCRLPRLDQVGDPPDQVNDPVQEKISEKNGSMDHYATQRHTEQGFQVDHISDPQVIHGSRNDPMDQFSDPVEDISDEQLAQLLEDGGHD
jgi:hypothetical protein